MHKDPKNDVASSIDALRHNFFLILGISIIVFVFSFGISKKIPGTYESHFSYMISLEQKDATTAFRYDGFYGLSAADLFSATIASIATSPETIVAMFTDADIALPTQDAIDLGRLVTSNKEAPQLVRLSVRSASKSKVEKLTNSLISVMNKSIDEYNTKGLSSVAFRAVPTQVWVSYNAIKPLPVASSLFMLVFVGGNIAVLFRESLRGV
ncbi:MAG: hypothetical protein O3A36_02630 [bacterium]|nr:hypothetical protein [bacterium]